MGMFDGKKGLVFGVANDRSIAWAITEALHREGAQMGFTHLPGDRSERRVRKLVDPIGGKFCVSCDVQKDEELDRVFATAKEHFGTIDFLVHSVAFAPTEELRKPYLDVSRPGWQMAMDISAYSLVAMAQRAAPMMNPGGTMITISYFGGERVIPGYNLMGVCKAALEHTVRYLAWDLGSKNLRINNLSAGPMRTLSSAGITKFEQMQMLQAHCAPLRRNVEFEELGTTALYLLSNMSNGVTGETVHVDCGYNIMGRISEEGIRFIRENAEAAD